MRADNDNLVQAKTCTKCGQEKYLCEFSKSKSGRFGVRSACKACTNKYNATYRAENPELVKAATQRWRSEHAEHVKEYNDAWLEANPDYHKVWRIKKYGEPKPRTLISKEERDRQYYEANRTIIIARATKWNTENRDRSRKHGRAAQAKRRMTAKGRIDDAISAGLRQSIKSGSKAGRKWEALVGYTVDELMAHLEKLFQPGMSWDNFGEWHIDHIIPKSAFNYESPDDHDFQRCWALDNLRPLWAFDNISKGAKLDRPFQPSLALSA